MHVIRLAIRTIVAVDRPGGIRDPAINHRMAELRLIVHEMLLVGGSDEKPGDEPPVSWIGCTDLGAQLSCPSVTTPHIARGGTTS
jgi:hypothetical protein